MFLAPNGANSAASYAFTNDTDTGIYLKQDGLLGLAGAGTEAMYVGGSVIKMYIDLDPEGQKLQDQGSSSHHWDDVHADDFQNEAGIPFMDSVKDKDTGEIIEVDDLEVIKSIQPKKKNGEIVYNEEGFAEWDDSTLPEWIFTRDENDPSKLAETPGTGEKWVSLSTLDGLSLGAIKKLTERLEEVEDNQNKIIDWAKKGGGSLAGLISLLSGLFFVGKRKKDNT